MSFVCLYAPNAVVLKNDVMMKPLTTALKKTDLMVSFPKCPGKWLSCIKVMSFVCLYAPNAVILRNDVTDELYIFVCTKCCSFEE